MSTQNSNFGRPVSYSTDGIKINTGTFNHFGANIVETRDQVASYSVCFIENENGKLIEVNPGDVQFTDGRFQIIDKEGD